MVGSGFKKILTLLAGCCLHGSCEQPDGKAGSQTQQSSPLVAPVEPLQLIPDSIMQVESAAGTVGYSVLIPAAADPAREFPALFFVDPDGNGALPLALYRSLAVKYGLVMAGSHLSKNGQSADVNARHVMAMAQDLMARGPVDKNRLFLAGFSGGSRVASLVAMQSGMFNCVMAAGAGMIQPDKTTASQFYYVGMAGRMDFNFLEMFLQHAQFERNGFASDLVLFDGTHDWPPVPEMEKALALGWLHGNAGHNDHSTVLFASVLRDRLSNDVRKLKKEKRFLELKFLYEQAMRNAADSSEHNILNDARTALLNSGPYLEEAKQRERMIDLEHNLKARYTALLEERDAGWWASEMEMLDGKARNSGDALRAELYARLTAYIRLAAYQLCGRYQRANEKGRFFRQLNVYKAVDPLNPEPAYLEAVMYARNGSAKETIERLGKAVQLGHKKRMQWKDDPEFKQISRAALDSLVGIQ